ncbi:MAG TPA: outer membrane beta-barrel protein [Steroidobacteraceae bacterium]|jgi:opacity protein-like surface antigen|nr:outer membrane beta-barrel protein [Steroidobacteraceae bacterium]
MRKAILFAVALFALPAVPAVAADNGFYLGASVGQANLKIDDLTNNTFNDDDFEGDDLAFKLIAGMRPLDWLGVEAAYVNFGEPEDTVVGTKLKADGDGISAFAVGFLATGPVDLFAKVGLISWDSKISGSFDDDGTDLAYGAGAQFRVLGLSVRAEYEKFDISDVDLDMISVGVTYTFL